MQVLRAVITSGSVTAAAGHLGYTPSAVSQQVAALEKQAKTALLERVGRGVRPTAAGRLLAEHAEIISRDLAAAEAALADLRAGHTGRLAVRYFASAGAALVAPALVGLRRTHPRVPIDLRLADPAAPLHEVEQGRADLALAVGPDPRPYLIRIKSASAAMKPKAFQPAPEVIFSNTSRAFAVLPVTK